MVTALAVCGCSGSSGTDDPTVGTAASSTPGSPSAISSAATGPAPTAATATGSAATSGPATGASPPTLPTSPGRPADATATAPAGGPKLQPVPPTFSYEGLTWTNRATDMLGNCVAAATGKARSYLTTNPCRQASRTITTTSAGGRAVVVTRLIIVLPNVKPSPTTFKAADGFLALVRDGQGDLRDLFQDGVRYPGGPAALPIPAAFGVVRQDVAVVVVRAAYLTGSTNAADPALAKIVQAAYTLQTSAR